MTPPPDGPAPGAAAGLVAPAAGPRDPLGAGSLGVGSLGVDTLGAWAAGPPRPEIRQRLAEVARQLDAVAEAIRAAPPRGPAGG